ncbi:hypothetical protein TNCV_3911441 [Trichonephila clavipes]|nr:hypothetical protein TNCV_3911441 [Trichonephila clavipes]
MRYCRERKAVFDNSRNRRRNFDDVGTEEEIRRPNSSRRFTPSPTRPIPNTSLQVPVAISPIQSLDKSAGAGIRTRDLRKFSPTLCQLGYRDL